MNWFDDWALTLAVFIPAVGMVIVMVIPRAEEQLIKVVTLLTTLITFGVGIAILADFNYDSPLLQFNVKKDVDRRHQQPLPRRHRRHLAAAARAVDVHHRAGA